MSIARESLEATVSLARNRPSSRHTYLLRENFTADFDIIISTKAFMHQELLEEFDVNFWKYGIFGKIASAVINFLVEFWSNFGQTNIFKFSNFFPNHTIFFKLSE